MGIDSSSRICGIAVFKDQALISSQILKFKETFSLDKFKTIIDSFAILIKVHKPDLVILEDPLAVRNGKTTRILNQIAGGILALAVLYKIDIMTIHNKTVKHLVGIKTKEDSLAMAKLLYGKTCSTADESDAILLVRSYYEYPNRPQTKQGNRKTTRD